MPSKEGSKRKAPNLKSGAWKGKAIVPVDEWVQAQLANAPEPGPKQLRTLAAILGLEFEG